MTFLPYELHRDFASLGYTVSKNTLSDYLGYLEDAFLVFHSRNEKPRSGSRSAIQRSCM